MSAAAECPAWPENRDGAMLGAGWGHEALHMSRLVALCNLVLWGLRNFAAPYCTLLHLMQLCSLGVLKVLFLAVSRPGLAVCEGVAVVGVEDWLGWCGVRWKAQEEGGVLLWRRPSFEGVWGFRTKGWGEGMKG